MNYERKIALILGTIAVSGIAITIVTANKSVGSARNVPIYLSVNTENELAFKKNGNSYEISFEKKGDVLYIKFTDNENMKLVQSLNSTAWYSSHAVMQRKGYSEGNLYSDLTYWFTFVGQPSDIGNWTVCLSYGDPKGKNMSFDFNFVDTSVGEIFCIRNLHELKGEFSSTSLSDGNYLSRYYSNYFVAIRHGITWKKWFDDSDSALLSVCNEYRAKNGLKAFRH